MAAVRDTPGQAPKENREAYLRNFSLVVDGLRESGLEDLTGVGASSFAVTPTLTRSKFFMHHAAGKGQGFLWALLGPAPHKLEALSLLPPKTAFAAFTNIDPALLVSLLHRAISHLEQPAVETMYTQAMAQISAFTGLPADQALSSLAGTAGLIVTLDPANKLQTPAGADGVTISIPRPALALLLPSKDDRIYQQLAKMVEANPGTTRTDEGDLHLRVAAEMSPTPELKLHPALARWKEWMILASDESLVREIIAAKTSGQGFASTPAFTQLSAGLPAEGNTFQLATELFTRTMQDVQAQAMKTPPAGANAQQAALLQKVFAGQAGASSYAVSTHLPNGWFAVGNTLATAPSQGFGTTLGNLLSVALQAKPDTAVAAAGDGTPAAQSRSRTRQIALACQMYATDHEGKFPAGLKELVPQYIPDASVLKSPLAPDQEEGYRYTPGLTNTSPAETVLVEDLHVPPGHPRIGSRVDASDLPK